MSDALARSRVFVGGISWKADEASLANFFSSYGVVTECKIIMDRTTGKSKGYGFVTFQDAESADRVKQTANFYFLGKNMNVGDAMRKSDSGENLAGGSPTPSSGTAGNTNTGNGGSGSGGGGGSAGSGNTRHKNHGYQQYQYYYPRQQQGDYAQYYVQYPNNAPYFPQQPYYAGYATQGYIPGVQYQYQPNMHMAYPNGPFVPSYQADPSSHQQQQEDNQESQPTHEQQAVEDPLKNQDPQPQTAPAVSTAVVAAESS